MKHSILFSSVLCLIIGLFCGMIIPAALWNEHPAAELIPSVYNGSSSAQSAVKSTDSRLSDTLNPEDNAELMSACFRVLNALKEKDYELLASTAHPDKGVTFTPYSTVEPDSNINLSALQISKLASDETVYTWGHVDGRGSLIEMTIPQYLESYVYDADYSQAPEIGIDRVLISGNALENVAVAYPNCRYVDFCYPSLDPVNQGLDWHSLKLVFEPGDTRWLLVGIIHSQWTI